MRLIDADELKKELYQQWFMDILLTQRSSKDMFYALAQKIDNQPTAYDVDKVVEQLEEEREYSHADFEQYAELHGIDTENDWFYAGLKRAIEIVKAGGINE